MERGRREVGERWGMMSRIGRSSNMKVPLNGLTGGVWSGLKDVVNGKLLSFFRQLGSPISVKHRVKHFSIAYLSEQYKKELLGEIICFSQIGLGIMSFPTYHVEKIISTYQNCKKLAAIMSLSSSSFFKRGGVVLVEA